ncbi:hypothetical protein LEP1GSC062_4066 [Leptospira alexanderi serovar Manhao 3 str. L 60]|uniref:Transposase, IS4-like family protein n=1 Tax=Leptospira alexanderi serovar Manhao 3 str. L 60 TaxID=1049759 RepID=V6I5D9_9LEPT|nr:hypothetical protein LEP1GSC062_4066 [Leptospira alexanderi serovar Manhao 3 str. L 60]
MAITLTGANVHDKRGVKDTLNSILVFSGRKRKKPKHLCLDKGYDFKDIEAFIKKRNIRDRKAENYLASLYLASSIIAFNFLIGSFETGSK